MSAIRSKHTLPERALRKALRQAKVKYKLHYSREKIDIAIPSKRLAIFIDGCFWHGCPKHGHKPKTNKGYWLPKLRKNKMRDKAKTARLRAVGWKVVRFWEHDVQKRLVWCVNKIAKLAR
ncbi:very short patch repair endonuclease [Candidatus Micrarchaeota archaeon]|nr:very short patch repair endonuclease [Candidatus Micrarchaeota archaeon]